jgi:hypothetical protein
LRNELEELSADLDTAAKDTSKANTVAKACTLVPHHRKHAIGSLQHERPSRCARTHDPMRVAPSQPHQLAQKTLAAEPSGRGVQCWHSAVRDAAGSSPVGARTHAASRKRHALRHASLAPLGTFHVRCQVVPEKLAAEVATLQQTMLRLLDTDTSRAIIEPDFAKWIQATKPSTEP